MAPGEVACGSIKAAHSRADGDVVGESEDDMTVVAAGDQEEVRDSGGAWWLIRRDGGHKTLLKR